jgi:hypothetical protein
LPQFRETERFASGTPATNACRVLGGQAELADLIVGHHRVSVTGV